MAGKMEFIRTYQDTARQMAGLAFLRNWLALYDAIPTLTGEEAGKWANLGYQAEEAAQLIFAGKKADEQAVEEAAEEAAAGGPDEHLEQRIAALLAQPGWYGPDDVVRVADPVDAGVELIVLREEL